jgi:hypothetical protein
VQLKIATQLLQLGANPDGLCWLDEDGPQVLPYASLIESRREQNSPLHSVVAVYEWQSAPLMFVVDGEAVRNDKASIERLRTILSLRGDAPYLGILKAGHLEVHLLALGGSRRRNLVELELQKDEVDQTFPVLANTRPAVSSRQKGWVSDVVLRLLDGSISDLISRDIKPHDAISLVGRALFSRFLADRGLLPLDELGISEAGILFDFPSFVRKACDWLDVTFNGNLLPIDRQVIDRLTLSQCAVLGNIMRRAPNGQLYLGWKERWDNLDFAHIPVGVLSQAYEQHLRTYAEKRQRAEGSFYTPLHIAQLLVRATLRASDTNGGPKRPRLLDPAAGAGVFLITAFRELIAKEWKTSGIRPGTEEIRRILYDQLAGFDVNEAALRFAALGLYLAAIEMDPDPHPVGKLKFRDLRGLVLFHVGNADDESVATLGSLGDNVGKEHDGAYDVVLGNPPWSSGTKLADWPEVLERVRRITAGRRDNLPTPILPNEPMDLPFVWRAMEWCRPGGQIAFALHARLLFQYAEGMDQTRAVLFSCIETTSIINGSDLRQTKVWPHVLAPFCILFARNRVPGEGHGFRFVSPRVEQALNQAGVMRVDALRADLVLNRDAITNRHLFKMLHRGSSADVEILGKLSGSSMSTLPQILKDESDGAVVHGNGYQNHRLSSRPRKVDGKFTQETGVDAGYLHGLPHFRLADADQVLIKVAGLRPFSAERIHDRRQPELFQGPLLLVRQTPTSQSGRIQLSLTDGAAVFSESFYGYSAHSIRDARVLQYLVVMLGSRSALWVSLMTSAKFGVERDAVEKSTIDAIMLPNWTLVSEDLRARISIVFETLATTGTSEDWAAADDLAADIYGFSKSDRQVIKDTLDYNLPYASSKERAQKAVSDQEVVQFTATVEELLAPLAVQLGIKISLTPLLGEPHAPWKAMCMSTSTSPSLDLAPIFAAADALAATAVTTVVNGHSIAIARLNQARYWTRTEASRLASEIAWSYLPKLVEKAS